MKFPTALIVKTSDDQLQVTASCVERWAARLARSNESADTVARAALAGCHDAITYLVDMTAKDNIANALYSDTEYWKRRALFVAVQTKAGNCYPDA